jgi:hypothetical protein
MLAPPGCVDEWWIGDCLIRVTSATPPDGDGGGSTCTSGICTSRASGIDWSGRPKSRVLSACPGICSTQVGRFHSTGVASGRRDWIGASDRGDAFATRDSGHQVCLPSCYCPVLPYRGPGGDGGGGVQCGFQVTLSLAAHTVAQLLCKLPPQPTQMHPPFLCFLLQPFPRNALCSSQPSHRNN